MQLFPVSFLHCCYASNLPADLVFIAENGFRQLPEEDIPLALETARPLNKLLQQGPNRRSTGRIDPLPNLKTARNRAPRLQQGSRRAGQKVLDLGHMRWVGVQTNPFDHLAGADPSGYILAVVHNEKLPGLYRMQLPIELVVLFAFAYVLNAYPGTGLAVFALSQLRIYDLI